MNRKAVVADGNRNFNIAKNARTQRERDYALKQVKKAADLLTKDLQADIEKDILKNDVSPDQLRKG
jgi:hypothetical protein